MRIDDTKAALESYRDDERFEELSSRLLSQVEPRIRPLGGRGDRARDAVAGLYQIPGGEELVAMYSLQKAWDRKIADELRRIRAFGWQPKHIIAVTNRALDRDKERVLQGKAEANGWALTIHGQEWLANKLHLRDNLDLRSEYLGLARPEPDLFMLAHDFWAFLQERGQPPVRLVGRDRELRAAHRLHTSSANVLVEADGGLGKTRLAYEMSQDDPRGRRWFFVPEGLPFQPSRLSELESGDEIVVVVDDAHRRRDLRALLAGIERRVPRPQIVLISRPGYDDDVERARRGLAFGRPETIRLWPLGRKDIVTLLRQPPFELRREGTLLSIVQLSGGNPQIAIIAGQLAASGKKAPHDLASGDIFRDYVDSLLDAAPAMAPEARELLALTAALRTLNLASADDVAIVTGITGLDSTALRRRLAALADSGLVIELSNAMFTIKPDLLSEEILRYSFFDERRRPAVPYATVSDLRQPLIESSS